jgi:hypothetical protein
MTKLGWISAVLFFVQAGVLGLAINDFNAQAQSNNGMAAYECDNRWGAESQTPNQNERLNCLTTYWKLEDDAKSSARYAWIGLAIGSVLTLAGVWKGYRDA